MSNGFERNVSGGPRRPRMCRLMVEAVGNARQKGSPDTAERLEAIMSDYCENRAPGDIDDLLVLSVAAMVSGGRAGTGQWAESVVRRRPRLAPAVRALLDASARPETAWRAAPR